MDAKELKATAKNLEEARRLHVAAEERYFDEVIAPKLQKMVGEYWVYRGNCYSCPEKPSDYWDMHARVESVDGAMITLTVAEVDSYGAPKLIRHTAVVSSFKGEMPTKWEKSTRKRFNAEVHRVLDILKLPEPRPI